MKKPVLIFSCHLSQTILCLSIFTILAKSTNGVNQSVFLKNDCSTTENYGSETGYQNNLHLLLANFTSKAKTTTFYNSTIGRNTDKIYGLFLCNSLLVNQVCHDCITSAATQIGQSCPSSSESTVWYTNCMLRYSNRDIFSVDDVSVYYNILMGPTKFSQFDQRLSDSFINLINMFVTDNSSSTSSIMPVYVTSDIVAACYVQCTPDIGQTQCNQCLHTALGRLEFDGSQSGTVLQPSCRLNYFFSDTASISKGKELYIAASVIIAAVAVASVVMNFYVCLQRRKIDASLTGLDELDSMEHLRFDFATIKEATDNFSEANKLGEGGFGIVYLGTFSDGKTVAVKRLSNASTSEGIKQFKTEACLTARLQHRNLVKLFGFCLEKQEILLVYEYMANKSLDRLLFGLDRGAYLKWKTRYKIIVGLARGLSYLHEDSQPQIIHRDLKPSNILLDEDMNPRIADFGIAKPFRADQTQVNNISTVAGTRGYMTPEYVANGLYSSKADIFSYGVILLEILSGLKNNCSHSDIEAEDLPNHAWGLWNEGSHLKLVDSALQSDFSKEEVERCLRIGLLCVQNDPAKRPDMSSILLMLSI